MFKTLFALFVLLYTKSDSILRRLKLLWLPYISDVSQIGMWLSETKNNSNENKDNKTQPNHVIYNIHTWKQALTMGCQ